MQLTRCPNCHSRISLEAIIQDDASRDLLVLIAKLDKTPAAVLVSYLSLFRSKSRDLANDRALRLASEVLEMAPIESLVPVLAQVVEQMRTKQQAGNFKPLNNHNYLKKVLGDSGAIIIQEGDIESLPDGVGKNDKRAAVTSAVMNIKDTDW
ncbi:hypothetical protein [Neptuniibacter sp.]|uniref:hypothetical protein n=1 Tax=Neptuniibacter sp. TaxID=1962643 RepID=UPI003B5C09E0